MGQINRTGRVVFGDASLSVWVEGLAGIPTDRIAELECQKNACQQVISEREQRIAELEAENARLKALEDKIGSGWALVEYEEMERNYSHQLGEIARLSGDVCSWVTEQIRTSFIPEDVLSAVNEIMQYVDAVRPVDGEKTNWHVHIIGPDDVILCRGEFDALRKANQYNITIAKFMADDPSPNNPYCVALACINNLEAQ